MAVAAVVVVLAAACSPASEATRPTLAPSRSPHASPTPHKDPLVVTAEDIQAFWSQHYPELYDEPYEPLPMKRIFPAGTRGVTVPMCAGQFVLDRDWEDNAFYCYGGNYLAFDARPGGLIQRLLTQFGLPAVGAVFAHEWGHAIQDRAGNTRVPTIYAELQADCFSGAWVAHVADGQATGISLAPGDLDQVLAAMLSFRDAPGSRPTAADAHGSGFDRISAFQQGYTDGADACVDYFDDPPYITEVRFTTARELANQGNVAAPKVLPASVELLNDFYSRAARRTYEPISPKRVYAYDPGNPPDTLPECGGTTLTTDQLDGRVFVCEPDRFVVVDTVYLQRIYQDIGDFGVTTLVAVPWAVYVQQLTGVETAGQTEATARLADCYTGGFAYGMTTGQLSSPTMRGVVSLSGGDLDEAISAFLDADQLAGGEGDAVFSRVRAFRGGFFQGFDSCDAAWLASPTSTPTPTTAASPSPTSVPSATP